LKTKIPVTEPDNIVLLLCKQDSEYFVMDVRLKDDQDCTPAQRLEHIQQSLRDDSLLELLGNVECVDIVDLADLPADMFFEPDSRLPTCENLTPALVRPTSSGSTVSTSTFLSFMSPLEGSSRPQTGDDMSTSEEAIYQLLCDAEWMLNSEAQEIKRVFDRLESNVKLESSCRPATAISLMKLPNESRPILIIPKSRPVSADMIVKDLKSRFKFEDLLEELRPSSLGFGSIDLPKLMTPEKSLTDLTPKRNSLPIKSSRSGNVKKGKRTSVKKFEAYSSTRSSPLMMSSKKDDTNSRSVRLSNCTPKRPLSNSSASLKKNIGYLRKPFSVLESQSNEVLQFQSNTSGSRNPSRGSVAQKLKSCMQCKKKLGPAQIFNCKCNKVFCSMHRYSDRYGCTHDYKTDARKVLARDNPCVTKEKIIRL
jgi:hypothetical protein